MLLGDLISRFNDESTALEMLLAIDDLGLLVRVNEAAEAKELPVGAWAREAVGSFSSSADDAQWLGLMAACANASDPGSAALRRMLETALAARRASAPPILRNEKGRQSRGKA